MLDAASRNAAAFLDRVAGNDAAQGVFPPESYLHDLGQVEILTTLLNRVYEQTMQAKTGLALVEWRALEAIGYAPGITASELASYWEYDKVSVGRALNSLKKNGLVISSPHHVDKRKTELRLSESGRVAFTEHLEIKQRYLDALRAVVSPDELAAFNATTRKLVEHFRKVKQVAKKR